MNWHCSPVPRSRAFYPFVVTGEVQIRGGLPISWNDAHHVNRQSIPILEPHKGEVIRFIPKSELERARLVREARAIYDGIFPPADAISETTRRRSIRVDFAPPPVAGRTQLCVSPRYPPFAGPATTQFLACDARV